MSNNIFEIIAKHLGVELDDEFQVKHPFYSKVKFRITENDFERADYGYQYFKNEWSPADRAIFFALLRNKYEIKKLSWLPKNGETIYWWGNAFDNTFLSAFMTDNIFHLSLLKHGLLFRTQEEAATIGKERLEQLQKEYENGTICQEVNNG